MTARFARLLLILCLALPAFAEAKPGLIVFNYGEELFELPPIAALPAGKAEGAGAKLGYKCSHFGIMWADVWTWDCRPVLIAGEDRYLELPPAAASVMTADPRSRFSKVKRSFWNKYAFWVALAGLLVWQLHWYRRRASPLRGPAVRPQGRSAAAAAHGDFEATVPAAGPGPTR